MTATHPPEASADLPEDAFTDLLARVAATRRRLRHWSRSRFLGAGASLKLTKASDPQLHEAVIPTCIAGTLLRSALHPVPVATETSDAAASARQRALILAR